MTPRMVLDSSVNTHAAATGIASSALASAPSSLAVRVARSRLRQPRHLLTGRLGQWLARAMPLPGKAVQVAIQILHDVDLAKSNEVSISLSGMAKVGISRYSAMRGLVTLEKAGLVTVVRQAGRKPVVMVVTHAPPPPTSPDTTAMAERDKVVVAQDDRERG